MRRCSPSSHVVSVHKSSFLSYAVLALSLVLQGCFGTYSPNKIDPAGNMTRADYLALRDRGDAANGDETPQQPQFHASAPAKPPAPLYFDKLSDKPVSVNVTESVPLREVLMDLAREGALNLELDPRIQGGIIFTAHKQPLGEVIKRLCLLAGLRYKVDGKFLRIELDEPYQQTYPIDYISLSRRATSEVTIATNVFDVDVTSGSNGGTSVTRTNSSGGADNNSTAKIAGSSDADFWSEMEKSLTQILAASASERPLLQNASTSVPPPTPDKNQARSNFTVDKQAGLVTVFATARQQNIVREYLRRLQRKATAQVLIEARIVEVELSDEFKSGINWRTLFKGSLNAASRFGTVGTGAPFTTASTATDGLFTASYDSKDFAGILSLVQTFGTTRVLSSPRLTVLNNQTAVLKVARNAVYFVTTAQFSTTVNATTGTTISSTPVFSSTPHTVPVGLVMTVQPSVDLERGRITMTLRPTISRVVDQVKDPSIGLNAATAGVTTTVDSEIPVLAVREMDSVVQLNSGEVAIMGGLMQDSSTNQDQGIPGVDTMPIVGNLFKSRDNQGSTSELVVLLRATVVDNPTPDSADADLYVHYNNDPRPFQIPSPPL